MKYALITGGSSGLGAAFAEHLSNQGYHILIVSYDEKANQCVAQKISKKHSALSVDFLTLDLSLENAAEQVYMHCSEKQLEVEILINNAGMFFFELLDKIPLEKIQAMLQLHIHTPTKLCALFAKDMKERGKGYILNTSSFTAWMSYPALNLYANSKLYLKNFSRSLALELNSFGVKVMALCPGAIDTTLYRLSEKQRKLGRKWGVIIAPELLAKRAVKALFKGKVCYVPGFINKLVLLFVKITPFWVINLVKMKLDVFKERK